MSRLATAGWLALFVIISILAATFVKGIETPIEGRPSQIITEEVGSGYFDQIQISDNDLAAPKSFLGQLFSGNKFSFTSKSAYASYADLKFESAHGWYFSIAGLTPLTAPPSPIVAGANCKVGEYIYFVRGEQQSDGSIKVIEPLYDKIWYKSSTTDLVRFLTYPVNYPTYFYAYNCYSSNSGVSPTVQTFTCTNNIWKGDPKTTYSSMQGVCTNGCLVGSITTQTNDPVVVANNICKSKPAPAPTPVVVPETKVSIQKASAPASDITVGSSFTVSGVAYVDSGICTNCVVETTFDQSQGLSALSVVDAPNSRTGACSDTRTVGTKFTAVGGDAVNFKLFLVANQTGKYSVPVRIYSGCGGTLLSEKRTTVNIVEKQVTCYQCNQNVLSTNNYPGVCPDGYTSQKPTCDQVMVSCYSCNSGSIVVEQFASFCPTGTQETAITSCKVSCFDAPKDPSCTVDTPVIIPPGNQTGNNTTTTTPIIPETKNIFQIFWEWILRLFS